ncbi:MAG: methylamine utilization protein [Burkholderiales bacterium PBB4]|nr:MAG: methylamine utilization protein [Burkholderiales bacterium PBB4]
MKQILSRCMAVVVFGSGVALHAQASVVQIQVQDEQGKALPDAAVFLESREAKQLAKPLQGAEMGQSGRQFVPHVLVVPTGTAVSFPNRDTVRHHVYSFSPTKKFELKLFTGTPANPVVFDKAGVAVLGCNIHDNMAAWVVVVDTPYFGLSDGKGAVSLHDVAPGNYRLRVWHSRLPVGAPATDQAITVNTAPSQATVRLTGLMP